MITIAVSSNAKKKRLSIDGAAQEPELLRVPDRIRRDGMGGTARCGGLRASYPAALRDVRALRWHKPSSSDNNGTSREVGGPA
jgi:hypothetical protein